MPCRVEPRLMARQEVLLPTSHCQPHQRAQLSTIGELDMFSPALGRAFRSTCVIAGPPTCANRPATVSAIGAASQAFSRRPHQRRRSSSKASIPPDGSNGSSSTQTTPGTSTARSPAKKVTGRTGRKKLTPIPTLNIPHVPPTSYLQKPGMYESIVIRKYY